MREALYSHHISFFNLFVLNMQISVASILATAAFAAGIVSAAAPKVLVFVRYMQVWFENQVIN